MCVCVVCGAMESLPCMQLSRKPNNQFLMIFIVISIVLHNIVKKIPP